MAVPSRSGEANEERVGREHVEVIGGRERPEVWHEEDLRDSHGTLESVVWHSIVNLATDFPSIP
jgi:hypothetical protein